MDPTNGAPNANLSAAQFGMSGDLGSSGTPSVIGAGNASFPAAMSGAGSASGSSWGMGGSY